MRDSVVPMIHVPDVRATVDWNQPIAFTVIEMFDVNRPSLIPML
jgi:hypothetical protein